MDQVWKQSLTQVCFHLENNNAQELLRKKCFLVAFLRLHPISQLLKLEKEHANHATGLCWHSVKEAIQSSPMLTIIY